MRNRIVALIATAVLVLSTYAASVETDRTWYLAGEAMRVSVAVDSALIAYAELCDAQGLAAGTMIYLKEGRGKGSIELPSDLHSGYYVLSVYARGYAHVSHRLVAVVNSLRKSVSDDIEWIKVAHPDSLSYVQTDEESANRECQWIDASVKMRELAADERETEGHILKARVRNVYDGNTFKGSQICPSLSIVGKQIHYFGGKMVDDSTAVFYTFGIHGKQPLVLSAVSSIDVSLPIEVASPFAALLPQRLPHLVFHYQRGEVEARSLDMQLHQLAITPAKREVQLGDHSDETAEESVPLEYDETLFGTKPDMSYNLDEYRQFLSVKEVLIEYVLHVTKKKVNGATRLFVRNESDHYASILPTLVLIDGMPVNNIERLLNYDARRIHYINIYSGQYTFGNGIYSGILSFVTRSGQLTNYSTEPNMQYLVYEFP